MRQTLRQRAMGLCVPDPGGAICRGGDNQVAIPAEGRRKDPAFVKQRWREFSTSCDLPKMRGVISPRGEEQMAIGAELCGPDRALMPKRATHRLSTRVPNARGAVGRSRDRVLAIGAEVGGKNGPLMAQRDAGGLTGLRVTHAGTAIVGSRQDALSLGTEFSEINHARVLQAEREKLPGL